MSREEAIEKLKAEPETKCEYCTYRLDCIETPDPIDDPPSKLCDNIDLEDLIDVDAYIEDMEVEE